MTSQPSLTTAFRSLGGVAHSRCRAAYQPSPSELREHSHASRALLNIVGAQQRLLVSTAAASSTVTRGRSRARQRSAFRQRTASRHNGDNTGTGHHAKERHTTTTSTIPERNPESGNNAGEQNLIDDDSVGAAAEERRPSVARPTRATLLPPPPPRRIPPPRRFIFLSPPPPRNSCSAVGTRRSDTEEARTNAGQRHSTTPAADRGFRKRRGSARVPRPDVTSPPTAPPHRFRRAFRQPRALPPTQLLPNQNKARQTNGAGMPAAGQLLVLRSGRGKGLVTHATPRPGKISLAEHRVTQDGNGTVGPTEQGWDTHCTRVK